VYDQFERITGFSAKLIKPTLVIYGVGFVVMKLFEYLQDEDDRPKGLYKK
jgi:hypothetical protein